MNKILRYATIIVFLTLSATCLRAQYYGFLPFPHAYSKYWKKAIPEEMRFDYVRMGKATVGGIIRARNAKK